MNPYVARDDADFAMKKFENSAVTHGGLCPRPEPQKNRPWLPFLHPVPAGGPSLLPGAALEGPAAALESSTNTKKPVNPRHARPRATS